MTDKPTTEKLSLLELIPLEELQLFQDAIAQVNSIRSVITDPDGNPLTMPSKELSVCRLVLKSPMANSRCVETVAGLSARMRANRRSQYLSCAPCLGFGIVEAAIPIAVGKIHLANWWIGQYCPESTSEEQIRQQAAWLNIDADRLIRLLADLPRHDKAGFDQVLTQVAHLANRMVRLGYQNRVLSQDVKKIQHLEYELSRYEACLEEMVQDRTADLLESNQRMKLEVLERDLIEEQSRRKSRLLDAVNRMLQSNLIHQSDTELAHLCLQSALNLTDSTFGFLVEYDGRHARLLARIIPGHQQVPPRQWQGEAFQIGGIWKQIILSGEPVLRHESLRENDQLKDFPVIHSLLAVPVFSHATVTGFIAVSGKQSDSRYATIDLSDLQSLLQAFSGALNRNRSVRSKRHSEKRLKLALDSANEGLWDFAPLTEETYFSPRWYTMLGYSRDEFPSTMETWYTLTHPKDRPLLKDTFSQLEQDREASFQIDIRMLPQIAQWRWIQVRGSIAERDASGKVTRIVGTLIDISKYKQAELALQKANAELQRLAALDDLTQIANRRRFEERLLQEWRRARRDHTPLALILCDIDFFKSYNDSYGHLMGDDALHAVAQAIQAVLKRSMDLVARFGGEEFAIILPNTDGPGAVRVAGDVQQAIKQLQIRHQASTIDPFVTCSYGVAALIPGADLTFKTLIDQSDRALYRAKANGRNRIMTYEEQIEDQNSEKRAYVVKPYQNANRTMKHTKSMKLI